ncbi:unnamed protein product [Amoebophrya sp. A25]|nr:unnamed protein product [Amoebophrya sp. A25]|eukprot:GSA25T00016467001.1
MAFVSGVTPRSVHVKSSASASSSAAQGALHDAEMRRWISDPNLSAGEQTLTVCEKGLRQLDAIREEIRRASHVAHRLDGWFRMYRKELEAADGTLQDPQDKISPAEYLEEAMASIMQKSDEVRRTFGQIQEIALPQVTSSSQEKST